jgi:phage shock protein PspC (stress-responsive transcriptional regulator)
MEQAKHLYRSRDNRIIAGVAGGLGEYFAIDPVIIRIIFAVLFFANGAGILIYILLWVIIPEEPLAAGKVHADKVSDTQPLNERVEKVANEVREKMNEFDKDQPSSRNTGGIILVLLGLFFLLGNLFSFDFLGRLWPLILIVIGIILLTRKSDKVSDKEKE